MKVETFKCATGMGWGILIDGKVDCDVPYARTEAGAVRNCAAVHPWAPVITSQHAQHYSQPEPVRVVAVRLPAAGRTN